jgi:sialic acid synthase SpsE
VDSAFSLEPDELRALVVETKRAWQALGGIEYGATGAQEKSLIFRRSIFVVKEVSPGQVIEPSHLRIVRPGHGLAPKFWEHVCGRTAKQRLKPGDPTTWDMFV